VTGDKVDVAQQQGMQVAKEVDRLMQSSLAPLTAPIATTYQRISLPFDTLPTREEWEARAKVLQENVEHHVEEEENELFPKAESALDEEELEELGNRMEAEKARKQRSSSSTKSAKKSASKTKSASTAQKRTRASKKQTSKSSGSKKSRSKKSTSKKR